MTILPNQTELYNDFNGDEHLKIMLNYGEMERIMVLIFQVVKNYDSQLKEPL